MIARLALVAVLVMTGCSTQNVNYSLDPAILDSHLSTLELLDSWDIRGRLSVRTDKGGHIGRIVWARSGTNHQIDIYGSLGSGHIRIVVDSREAVLTDSDGWISVGANAQRVLDAYLGWRFPVTEMESWILGKAYPDSFAEQKWDTLGHVVEIEQEGWQVLFSQYDTFDGYDLPTRYRILASDELQQEMAEKRPQAEVPNEIRLVISTWSLN